MMMAFILGLSLKGGIVLATDKEDPELRKALELSKLYSTQNVWGDEEALLKEVKALSLKTLPLDMEEKGKKEDKKGKAEEKVKPKIEISPLLLEQIGIEIKAAHKKIESEMPFYSEVCSQIENMEKNEVNLKATLGEADYAEQLTELKEQKNGVFEKFINPKIEKLDLINVLVTSSLKLDPKTAQKALKKLGMF